MDLPVVGNPTFPRSINPIALYFNDKQYLDTRIFQVVHYDISYQLSYLDIEEIFKNRGLGMDHATIHRWILEYAFQLKLTFRKKRVVVTS
ncbi:IS6 family transposase [Candidatus Enterovibrio escicola]|uniref:Mobile element protein n=1 Tax=Candidatus Enterovibrio escicola TaxID=1927127 RepID=A0A2A5T0Y3_9GAMM|nr:IS6 family transposase [Candidatus Enterovibrio escacola]PCS21822.1 Mobile element protein [Candidatus Enterovibrio escacola]